MAATVPPLVIAGWVSLRAPTRPTPARIGWRRVLPWVVVIAVGAAWELLALVRSPRADFPTLSSIVSPLAGPHWWFRFAGYLVWFAVGVRLVRG